MSKRSFAVAGAYIAWIMGSGFASGQEMFQFFTSFGYKSYIILVINLIGFLIVGPAVLEAGQAHRLDKDFNHFDYFCGKKLGTFYSWFLPINMFGSLIIMISGAGTALNQYFGINHIVGALIMAVLAFLSYAIGFERFIKIVSFTGPVIISFTLLVAVITVMRQGGDISSVPEYEAALADRRPVPFWWLSALLYISYNLWAGSKYYSALGASAPTRRDAVHGAIIGSIAIMLAILLMNTAMLTEIGEVIKFGVPTLYLARQISYVLGAAFSILLIMGIFSSASAMMWMVCDKFVDQGTRKGNIFSACVAGITFVLGLFPFADLIGIIYTISGYVGFILIGCIVFKVISKWVRSHTSKDSKDQ